MNSNHVINGWVAQLRVDARRGGRRSRTAVEPGAPAAPAVALSLGAQPAAPAVALSLGAEPTLDHPVAVTPTRTWGRLLPVRVWSRDGAPGRAVGGPCLSLG
jgi:hypothetical protein